MRVLLTAFEPFDGTGRNASEEGCREFLARWGEEFDLRFALLPVDHGRDVEALERALAGEGEEVLLLHTGQAAGSARIRVERIAVNVRYGTTARDGWDAQALIEPGGPAGLFSPLPVDAIAAAIRAEGVPAEVSNHAGIYLCNHVLYHSLRRGRRAGFLHVPALPEQVEPEAPSLPAAEIARAVRAALQCLERQAREEHRGAGAERTRPR